MKINSFGKILTRTLLAALLAFRFSLFAAYAGEPYSRSRLFWDNTTKTTIFSGGNYARVIELRDGRLMATCQKGGIVVAYSTNKGKSWSSEERIAYNPDKVAESVPDLIQLADGTIIVAYNPRPAEPYSEERKFGIRCKRSTDNGKTWGPEIFVNDASHTFADGCWEPSMLQLPSGEVHLYFADEGPYTNSNEQQISLCRSYDGGQTWTAAQRVIFRAGTRDGMPVPLLLKDGKTIAVVFEDNGWPGIGDFFPTIAVCPLATNWNNYWVDGNSSARWQTIASDYSPRPSGGAPYLRMLPTGETVISWQSSYKNNGKLNLWVAVGNEEAKDFRDLSTPFGNGQGNTVTWNSVAVVDTGVVMAIGNVNGQIQAIKGYPKRQFEAAYGSPKIDGKLTRNEGYLTSAATQITMGQQIGSALFGDLAYDRDSLYLFFRVSDRTQHDVGQEDGVRVSIDAVGAFSDATENVAPGLYRYFFKISGAMTAEHGERKIWRSYSDFADIHFVASRTSTYYILECAIPWTHFGLTAPLSREAAEAMPMAINIELFDYVSGYVTETIPDALANRSSTWMPLKLLTADFPTGIDTPLSFPPRGEVANGEASPQGGLKGVSVYDLQGRHVSLPSGRTGGGSSSLISHPSSKPGIYIVGGKKIVRK